MKNVLEINVPSIRSYPHYAFMFGVVYADDYNFDEFCHQYIQLSYNTISERIEFNIGTNIYAYICSAPYMERYCYIRQDVFSDKRVQVEFIKKMIDMKCYVYFLVDVFFIKLYKEWYNKCHMAHDILVYGYDEEFFYVADCFTNGIYSLEKIHYSELVYANLDDGMNDWLCGIHCLKKREKVFVGMKINPKEIKKALYAYMSGEPYGGLIEYDNLRKEDLKSKIIYGIKIYSEVIHHIEDKEYLDVRIPSILIDHKIILLKICEKLKCEQMINNADEDIYLVKRLQNKLEALKNLFLMYNITQACEKKRILKCAYEAEALEYKIVKKLLKDIRIRTNFKKNIFKGLVEETVKYDIDYSTQGDWIGNYGSSGYFIIGDKNYIPSETYVYFINCIYVSVFHSCGDKRALTRVDNDERPVAYYLNDKDYFIELDINCRKKISLYFVDYDMLNRKQQITVYDKKKEVEILDLVLSDIDKGVYLSFNVENAVIIKIHKIKGPNAVVSGVFIDNE